MATRDPREQWKLAEHDRVVRTLEHALRRVEFPAAKSDLAAQAGHVNVARGVDRPFIRYIEALPDREYRTPDDVRRALDERWRDARGRRGRSWEASARGGS